MIAWYEKILIPLDGSQLAEVAVDRATDMARKMKSKLVLLQVIPPPPTDVLPTGLPMDVRAEEERNNSALEYLASIRDNLKRDGIDAETGTAFGFAADGIMRHAVAVGATMIVMSTHGHGGKLARPLGSTAAEVLERSQLPVLAIPYR